MSSLCGRLLHILIADDAGESLRSLREAKAVAGRGLEGDRYFYARGTFNRKETQPDGRQLSLISQQGIETCRLRLGLAPEDEDGLPVATFRRNLVVAGVDLPSLMRRRFAVGPVVLRGLRPAPPCGYLKRHTGLDMMTGLKGFGGLRAEILEGGVLKTGDEVRPI